MYMLLLFQSATYVVGFFLLILYNLVFITREINEFYRMKTNSLHDCEDVVFNLEQNASYSRIQI